MSWRLTSGIHARPSGERVRAPDARLGLSGARTSPPSLIENKRSHPARGFPRDDYLHVFLTFFFLEADFEKESCRSCRSQQLLLFFSNDPLITEIRDMLSIYLSADCKRDLDLERPAERRISDGRPSPSHDPHQRLRREV